MSHVTTIDRQRERLEKLLVEAKWRRYANDPAAFLAECVWIPSERNSRGRERFELWDYQEETLATFLDERYIAVLKARQLGLTTLAMGYALWMLMFRPGANVLLVSKNQTAANSALDLLDFMWSFLPDWFKARAPEMDADAATHHSWKFADGLTSKITSYAATKTAGAGQTASLVLWDEAALATEQEDTLRTLGPTTDAGGSIIVFSTARGAHNAFARTWRDANRGDSEYVSVFHPWYVSRLINPLADKVGTCPHGPCDECIDRRQHDAKRKQFREEPWRFHAEYPETAEEAFRQSGRTRFGNLPPVEEFDPFPWRGRIEWDGGGGIRLVEDETGPLHLRAEAVGGAPEWVNTAVAVDPSGGNGGDYTVMTVGWLDEHGVPQRMGYWRDNRTEQLPAARQADLLGRYFAGNARAAMLAVEKQGGWGDTILNELSANLDYPNLYVHVYTGHRKRRVDRAFGFPMSWQRRPLVIDKLAGWLPREGDDGAERLVMGGIDPILRGELGTFVVRDDGKVAADVGCFDDVVMSTGIWLFVLVEELGAATPEPKGEKPSTVQRFSLDEMWQDVEKARALEDAAAARMVSRLNRSGRRRARR